MGIFRPIKVVCGRDASGSNNVLADPLNAGLDVPPTLPTLMIVAALANPLHQNGARMVAATLCTHSQLEDGMKHLTYFVKEYYKKEERNDAVISSGGDKVNKYDVPTNPDRTCRDSPAIKAEKEINQFFANNNYCFLPKMKALQTLGAVDEKASRRSPCMS